MNLLRFGSFAQILFTRPPSAIDVERVLWLTINTSKGKVEPLATTRHCLLETPLVDSRIVKKVSSEGFLLFQIAFSLKKRTFIVFT